MRVLLLLCLALAAEAAPDRRTFFLVPGKNRDLEELVRGALKDTGKLQLVQKRGDAELIGRLMVDRRSDGLDLELEVMHRDGGLAARGHEFVATGESVIDAAVRLAAQAADSDAPPPRPARKPRPPPEPEAPPPPPPLRSDDLRPKARPAASAHERDPSRDWRSPYDPDHKRLDFIVGLELSAGPWFADSAKLAAGSDSAFDLTHYAPAFAQNLDGHFPPGLGLHGGWMFLGAGSFELTYTASRWSGGSATLIGGRLAGYLFPALWPARWFDLGLEAGIGYSLLAGGAYTVSGGFYSLGVTAEYPLNHWLGVSAFYRLNAPFLKHFYIDYARGMSEPVAGVTYYWNSFGLSLNYHPALEF